MSTKIKFGTDGWRAIIGEDYTVDNVKRVSEAVAVWLKNKCPENPSIVIGHDCRFNGELFMKEAVKVFLASGIKVFMAEGFVSTPMVSLGANKHKSDLGVVITASHNPPAYNGYKLKASYGGPLPPDQVQEIQDIIKPQVTIDTKAIDFDQSISKGNLQVVDLEREYINRLKERFDLDAIRKSGLNLVFDAMYGAGQNVLNQLFPDMHFLHCDHNPGFKGQAPEPIAKNLKDLENFIKSNGSIDCGLATDGDADRIGLYNGKGEFVDSHHIILLLIHYLVNYEKLKGKVVTAFSCTPRIAKMCSHYDLEHETVKIGFKYVAGKMVTEDVLLGGEESGGIATKDHIPERDGIWMGLIIWEFMAKSGKTLDELIAEVYEIVGEFKFERSDLHINEDLKHKIVENCKNNVYKSFGSYDVQDIETIDGFKFYFPNERWVMIRPSGTEPVLRVYAEAPDLKEVREILKATEETIKA
jgi:phosphomannomutase